MADRQIYFCQYCNKTYSANEPTRCKCGKKLMATGISYDDWYMCNSQKKEEAKANWRKGILINKKELDLFWEKAQTKERFDIVKKNWDKVESLLESMFITSLITEAEIMELHYRSPDRLSIHGFDIYWGDDIYEGDGTFKRMGYKDLKDFKELVLVAFAFHIKKEGIPIDKIDWAKSKWVSSYSSNDPYIDFPDIVTKKEEKKQVLKDIF